MTACVTTPSEPGLCIGLRNDVAALRTALLDNPETPDAVGEAGTEVVIGFQAGCGR